MRLILASIQNRSKSAAAEELTRQFAARVFQHMPGALEGFPTEQAFLAAYDPRTARRASRTAPVLILFDRLGTELSSEEFARRLGAIRDSGAQTIVLAIGPANGWSPAARTQAQHIFSFGPITLPHELARVVLAEQTYRALTILAGHPYHCDH
jgi:23S rRNA (pseudouridine1915-N3)-methyltransferase